MTKQKEISVLVGEKTSSQEETPPGANNKKGSSLALSIVAIIITLVTGCGLYYYQHHQSGQQAANMQNLVDKLTALQQQSQTDNQALVQRLTEFDSALNAIHQQQTINIEELNEQREQLASLTSSDVNIWMISQADFLVKLAERKLWNDQDVISAGALLKSADSSLASMNDAGVIEARRALESDISNLAAINQVDFNGIILKLNKLSNTIDSLPLIDHKSSQKITEAGGNNELSSSLGEWRQNLLKSWRHFMEDFITIRRRDDNVRSLLSPDQGVYLRENIRSQLLIAAQAVPRHQNEIYKQSIKIASAWASDWFDISNPAVKVWLAELDTLSKENISIDIPSALKSQPLLNKLMERRVRNLLSRPGVNAPTKPQ